MWFCAVRASSSAPGWAARWGGAQPTVRNNLGLGLLSQAGVAIGLALNSASRFGAYGDAGQALGALVINVVTATTFVVQIIGPVCVKLAISRAGEIGRATLEHDAWASEGSTEGPHVFPPIPIEFPKDE